MASINGFTVVPYSDPLLGTYVVPGSTTRLSVRKEIAPLLIGFARDFNVQVELLNPKSCWGHAPRMIGSSGQWSFHAPGIALDLNAFGIDHNEAVDAWLATKVFKLTKHIMKGFRICK